jgi:hypothetical protein
MTYRRCVNILRVSRQRASTSRVDKSIKKSTRNRCKPRRIHTSTGKKSVATIISQRGFRNFF